MAAKFKEGDRVRFVTHHPKKKPSQDILEDYRRRSRAIIGAYYEPRDKCTYYELYGLPGFFRSYSLKLATKKDLHMRGTPRRKRNYARHKVKP